LIIRFGGSFPPWIDSRSDPLLAEHHGGADRACAVVASAIRLYCGRLLREDSPVFRVTRSLGAAVMALIAAVAIGLASSISFRTRSNWAVRSLPRRVRSAGRVRQRMSAKFLRSLWCPANRSPRTPASSKPRACVCVPIAPSSSRMRSPRSELKRSVLSVGLVNVGSQ